MSDEHQDTQPAPHGAGRIAVVQAPPTAEEEGLLERYAAWPDKGALFEGRRLTILVDGFRYPAGRWVSILHVLEATEPGHDLYIMGPKPVIGETVNGQAPAGAPAADGDPFAPAEYDGRVLPSPGVDSNFMVTRYRFLDPGRYEIRWQPGPLRSNRLVITVGEEERTMRDFR